jgi:hypothetical protein
LDKFFLPFSGFPVLIAVDDPVLGLGVGGAITFREFRSLTLVINAKSIQKFDSQNYHLMHFKITLKITPFADTSHLTSSNVVVLALNLKKIHRSGAPLKHVLLH